MKEDFRDFGLEGIEVLCKSNKIWSLYLDLEGNFGSEANVRLAFEEMVKLKTVTAYNVLTYTKILESSGEIEEAFRIFETSLLLFNWPHKHPIWVSYLKMFLRNCCSFKFNDDDDLLGVEDTESEDKIMGQQKTITQNQTERARDLFERVLRESPDKNKFFYFMLYSEFEEKHGLISHSIEILDRMTEDVPEESKVQAFEVYICQVSKHLGATKTRPIFEKAISKIQNYEGVKLGLTYIDFEKNIGEIDRARGIFHYLSQFCDPELEDESFWSKWEEFELKCGNEDTYKEMMRNKRAVQTVFEMLPVSMKKIQREIQLEERKEEINKKITGKQ